MSDKKAQIKDEKKITQVSAAILRRDDKILICQRNQEGSCSLLWEFPGGKQEQGESPAECLVRECREELGVTIQVGDVFTRTRYTYGDKKMEFTFFACRIIAGEVQKKVHRDIRWVKAEELGEYDFCPADVEVARKLGSGGEND